MAAVTIDRDGNQKAKNQLASARDHRRVSPAIPLQRAKHGKARIMKRTQNKTLTFGEMVLSVYSACKPRRARAILRFAVNSQLIVFHRHRRIVIA